MVNLIYRNNRLFSIDESLLPTEANKTPIKGALYAAIYTEFIGAAYSDKYKNLTTEQRLAQVNTFAIKWLKERGFNVQV